MLRCRMAMSSKGVKQRLEMTVDRQLLAGMVARAVGVTMLTGVGDDWTGLRHEPADSDMVAVSTETFSMFGIEIRIRNLKKRLTSEILLPVEYSSTYRVY